MAWAIASGLACSPRAETREPVVVSDEPGVLVPLPEELRGVVSPWQRVDPAWLERASVWVVGRYTQKRIHQQIGPERTRWLVLDAFTPTKVLRGVMAAPEVLLEGPALRGPAYPAALDAARSYLVLLRPTAETASRLADPRARFTMYERLGPAEVVAIVDLSQSAAEAKTETIAAGRSGEHEGARFDPKSWAEARAAPTITPDRHAPLGRFLAAQLRIGMTRDEVRAWVGVPDLQIRVGETWIERSWLAQPEYAAPRAGGVYGQLELRFIHERLAQGDLRYFRWSVTPDEIASIEVPVDELQRMGLMHHVLGP